MNADADFARCVRCGIGVVVTTAESWRNSAKNLTWWTAAIGNGPASSRRVGQDQELGRACGAAATKRIGMADWPPGAKKVKTVLFLCTGNYYRSRFAEELFNHHAERAGLDWTAQSRGLALERGAHNVGPISPVALHGLKEWQSPLVGPIGSRSNARPATWLAPISWLRSKKRNIGHSCESSSRSGSTCQTIGTCMM